MNAEGLPAATRAPPIVDQHAVDCPTPSYVPRRVALPPSEVIYRAGRRVHRRVFRPLTRVYSKLSWTTRQTISVSISLVTVVYTFLSVPFRIGFLYNPLMNGENELTHAWTRELSVLSTMDVVTDIIGVVEFLAFYRVWKDAFSQLSASVSFEIGKKLTRDANRLKTPKISNRTRSSRQGKVKWTLATIGPSSVMPGSRTDDDASKRNYMLVRNLELALEIVALFPIEVLPFASGAFNMLHLARLNKLCRIYRLRHCITRIGKIYSDRRWVQQLSSTGVDALVRNIGLCAALCHLLACGYMFIAHAQCGIWFEACDSKVESSWAIRDRLPGASVARKYGRTLYWASRTMVLLGYDDVTPVSDTETFYVVVVQIVGALFGSSMLATFLFTFRHRNSRYAAYSTHVDNAREYMRSQNIPRAVRRQVMDYFSYSWNTHHSLDSEEALHLMPKHLQSKVVATLKASRVKQVCFLMKESVEFINLLALALVRRVYSPADQIIEPKINAQMFFVIRGKVVLSAFNGSHPKECQTGDFFADSCLLFPEKYEEKAMAKTFCELYVLAKAKFDEALFHFYRGSETEARDRMADTLEKYSTQLRKTKKLLGLRGGPEGGGGSARSLTDDTNHFSIGKNSLGWRLPGSSFRSHWDTARLLATIYVAFEVPYFMVFLSMTEAQTKFVVTPELGMRYVLTLVVEILFGIDLVLRARYFAYLDPIVMLNVVDPELIFTAYKSTGFYLDLLAVFPVGLVLDSMPSGSGKEYAWIFRLLRMLRMREIPDLLQNLSDYYGMSSKLRLVLSLLLGVALMLHVVGCVWFEMAWIPEGSQSGGDSTILGTITRGECLRHATVFQNCSWVKFDCYSHVGDVFPEEDIGSVYKTSFAYLRSVYWAVVALTAVGYGDIVAYSTAESYFAALWIFVGGIINFGVLGAMSSIISNVLATRRHHIERLNMLNSIMERLSISEKLSAEIRRFYQHQFVGRKQAYESQLLSHLPDQLCYQISSLLHSDAVKSVTLFDSASIEFLQEVTGKFRHRTYQNGETIYLEGDICREFIVLLQGSKVNVYFHSRRVPIRALHEGDCYGVNEFLLKRAHPATLTAASPIHASVMTREQFDAIQRKFTDDLYDIREEAQKVWIEEQTTLRRIVRNLEKLKLQPHLLHTPTLFYQRDGAGPMATASSRSSRRDIYATRTRFVSTWNACITLWNVYNAYFIIFRICFHSYVNFSEWVTMAVWLADVSCDLFFAVDVYLRLYFLGCPECGFDNLLTRKEMDLRYRRSATFKWDLLASLPLYAPESSGPLMVGLFRLPRLIRCVDLWVYMDDVIVQIQERFASHNISAYLSPVKLMVVLVLVAHYAGCIFFWISEHECERNQRCWIAHDTLIKAYDHGVLIMYAKSFYWALTTLMLVGSRDIVSRDTVGTLWTTVTCLGCTFIMGHIVGELSELILSFGKEAKQYKGRIASFESFAKQHELPETLRARVGLFFRVQFEHTEGRDLHSTIHDLSANLRLQLMLEIYGRSIAVLPISRFLTSSQINNLALRLQSELFIPGDNILVEGTFGSRLCVLRKGLAAAYWTEAVASVAILMQGALFGEISFFVPEQRRIATVRATTSCEVLHVTKHDWQELWTSTGDSSDSQVQKHALHSILEWVYHRLERYQEGNLRTARKAKSALAARHQASSLHAAATAAAATAKAKAKLQAGPIMRTRSREPFDTSPVVAARPKGDPGRPFVSPEMQLLEKKAKYLLDKTDACAKQFLPVITAIQPRRKTVSTTTSARSARTSISRGKDGPSEVGLAMWRSARGDAASGPTARGIKQDIHERQFMVDLNPVNKHVRDSLSDGSIRRIESECWTRFKYCAAVQHAVSELMNELLPPETTFTRLVVAPGGQQAQIKINPAKAKAKRIRERTRSFRLDEPEGKKHSVQLLAGLSGQHNRKTIGPESAAAVSRAISNSLSVSKPEEKPTQRGWDSLRSAAKVSRGRRFSTAVMVMQTQHMYEQEKQKIEKEDRTRTIHEATLKRMTRCHSLPQFERLYFETARYQEGEIMREHDGQLGSVGIDFEILQRCQRPQYAAQLMLYHRYRHWKTYNQGGAAGPSMRVQPMPSETIPTTRHNDPNRAQLSAPVRTPSWRTRALSRSMVNIPGLRRFSGSTGPRTAGVGTILPLPNPQALEAVASELKAKEFIQGLKKLGKIWDAVMLFVAAYHMLITPAKVSFQNDLVTLSDGMLHAWSGFEIFLDILCVLDVGYKLRYASRGHHSMDATAMSAPQRGLRRVLASDPSLRAEILALLPLELLLAIPSVRIPPSYVSPTAFTAHISWWNTRSLLRANRMLFALRVNPLTDQLFQYLVYDRKLAVSESLLFFWRSLASYLIMGHLLACIWFASSELSLQQYNTSWLTASGMLTYIAPGTEATLAANSPKEFVVGVSMGRKYLRSLMYSLESITTLYYGDIVSMNLLEMLMETIITLASIYVYGALVGAQGELLDTRTRQEAVFEQSLAELQHYLVQNEVPKGLKRQIKAYYARVWQRRRGEDEFTAVSGVSRALYEDVVLATLRAFAVRVTAFREVDEHFLRALLVRLHYVVCSEGEEVVMKGDVDRSMYFIAQGRVLVKLDGADTTKECGEFFGELALLYGISRLETCVALTVAELYRLDSDPYEHLLRDFPEYRVRNRLAWTTAAVPPPESSRGSYHRRVPSFISPFSSMTRVMSHTDMASGIEDVVANAERIEAEVPQSYIYKSTMAMLAQLTKLDPLEAKDLVLKCRAGARRYIKAELGLRTSRQPAVTADSTDDPMSSLLGAVPSAIADDNADQCNEVRNFDSMNSTPHGEGPLDMVDDELETAFRELGGFLEDAEEH